MASKLVFWAVVILAAFFALQGGEYSTRDLWKQKKFKERLVVRTDSLARVVDSLRKEVKLVQTDRATQERIARERYGMVRGDREILYRFDEPKDSTSRR